MCVCVLCNALACAQMLNSGRELNTQIAQRIDGENNGQAPSKQTSSTQIMLQLAQFGMEWCGCRIKHTAHMADQCNDELNIALSHDDSSFINKHTSNNGNCKQATHMLHG